MDIKLKNTNLFKKEEIHYIYDISFGKNKNKSFKIKRNKMIKLEYKYDNKEKNIYFLGMNFIKSNKNKCYIIFNNKQYKLTNNIKELKDIKKKSIIQIKLRILENIIDLAYMFFYCSSLIYLKNISNINTNKVNNMSNLFYGCSSLSSLPDISK